MTYKVYIDKEKCVGCGSCSVLAPEIFGFDSETNTSFVKENADLTDLDLLLKSANSCPVLAIRVEDEDGKVLSEE